MRSGADLDLGRGGQAQRLEELLDGAEAGGGRALHRIGPAVGLVPLGDGAVLEQRRPPPWSAGLGLLGGLARTLGAGEHAGGERLDRHLGADRDDEGAAVGLDLQMRFQRLVVGTELVGADVDLEASVRAGTGNASRLPAASPSASQAASELVNVPEISRMPWFSRCRLKFALAADLQDAEVDLLRLEARAAARRGLRVGSLSSS